MHRTIQLANLCLILTLATACFFSQESDIDGLDSMFDPPFVADATPRTMTIEVGDAATVNLTIAGTSSGSAGTTEAIAVTTGDANVATGVANAGSGTTRTATITAVAVGQTTISFGLPGNASIPMSVPSVQVNVVEPAVFLEITPAQAQLSVNQSIQFECVATLLRNGQTLSNPTLVWNSSNTAVLLVFPDGRATAFGSGTAEVTCRATDGTTATATVTVTEQATGVPSLAELAGSYGLTASKKADACAAGLFPASITNPGNIVVQLIGTGQNPPVSIGSTANVVGIYNTMTGAYEGSGSTTVTFGGVAYNLIELITGTWSRTMSSSGLTEIRLQATLAYNAMPSGGTACSVEYDALYLRSF